MNVIVNYNLLLKARAWERGYKVGLKLMPLGWKPKIDIDLQPLHVHTCTYVHT